jgi:hypothetical protein
MKGSNCELRLSTIVDTPVVELSHWRPMIKLIKWAFRTHSKRATEKISFDGQCPSPVTGRVSCSLLGFLLALSGWANSFRNSAFDEYDELDHWNDFIWPYLEPFSQDGSFLQLRDWLWLMLGSLARHRKDQRCQQPSTASKSIHQISQLTTTAFSDFPGSHGCSDHQIPIEVS